MNLHRNFRYCTLCLSKDRNLLHVFDHSDGNIALPGVIRELLQFEVVQGGRVPWKICKNCFMKLNDFQHFKNHAKKCKEYLESSLLHGRRHLDSPFENAQPITLKTEEKDDDEMLSNESFTIGDGVVPKVEVMDDMPDRTEESHPTQTATPVLRPVEVFVDIDAAVESGEMTEEESDPLGGEDVKPSALIMMLDQGASREEDGASYSLPTGNPFAFCGELKETGVISMEASAMTSTKSSAKQRSSNVSVMYHADMVKVPVNGVGERVGGFEEKNSEGLIGTGHHPSLRLEQGRVPEDTNSCWMRRRPSSDSQNNLEKTKEGIESVPSNTPGEKFVEVTQRNAEMRIESEGDCEILIGDILSRPLTTDDESEECNLHCNVCGKVFSSNSLLTRHLMVHCGAEVFQCGDCRLKFNQRSEYDRHVSLQHGISISKRKWQRGVAVDVSGESEGSGELRNKILPTCCICNNTFSEKKNLDRHIKTVHLKERKFSCDICGKVFSRRSNLQTHLRYHSGLKPYTCSHCQKGFTQPGTMRKHILSVHKKVKPHTCGDCGKSFSYKNRLKSHALLHARVTPHT